MSYYAYAYTYPSSIINGGLAAFSPASLPNGILWIKAGDLSTITKDGGNVVSKINDKFASGNDLMQVTGIMKPIWNASGFGTNSTPYLNFDGINDFLESSAFTLKNQPFTIFIAHKLDTTASEQPLFDGNNVTNRIEVYNSGTTEYKMYGGVTLTGAASNTSDNLITAVANSTSSTLRLNGGSETIGDAGTQGLDAFRIGQNAAAGAVLTGRIAEIIIYKSILPQDDQTLVRDYLNNEHGIY